MDKELASGSAPAERSERQRPPIPKAAPWLVFPHGKGRKFQRFYNPCEPNNRNCIKSIPEMRGRACYHKPSHQGWLIVIGGVDHTDQYSVANSNLDDCFLWNPGSSETIQLPNLDRQSFPTNSKSKKYFMYDLVLSSPPLPSTSSFNSNPDQEDDCTVFLLLRGIDHSGKVCSFEHILVFCRPGDKQWKTKDLYANGHWSGIIESLLCFKGKLYAFCAENWVREIEIKKLWHTAVIDNQVQCIRTFKIEDANFTLIGGGDPCDCVTIHWVESGNEIFKVLLNCSIRAFRNVASTCIFRLDFSTMTWVLLKTLDDHVLFLCTNMDSLDIYSRKCFSTSTACCSAADMGLERGCLFYTLPEDQTLYTFELEDNTTTVIMPCLKLPTPWFLPTWIMMPTTESKHLGGRRRKITDLLLVSQDTTETSVEDDNMSRLNDRGGVLEALKQWDFLNDYDSMEAIARFLHPVDYGHFRLACKRSSKFLPALNQLLASTMTTAATYLSPWMISIFEDGEETICDIVDPMHNNDKYLMKLSDQLPVGATIRFSKDGWLMLSIGKNSVICYNPFTRAIIRLPDVPDDYVLGGMLFSSIPTSGDCVVIVISNWRPGFSTNDIFFLVTEPGKRATGWTIKRFRYESQCWNDFMPCINSPVFHKGAFYCLDYNGMLGIFDTKGDFSWKVLSKSLKQFGGVYPSFLVGCDEKLLLVNLGQSGKSVDVYRLDDSEMLWVKLNSLRKHALFISYASSFSVVAPRSCMENKIYFPRLYVGDRILYYSLDTCRYHCVGSSQHSLQDFHNTKERLSCTWIEPNWSQASLNQETDDIMLTI
ncbi:hypothetical protein MKX01_013064 [Papaver californicum]|nr:hypothetical protein MKX01_013064 [Papaver californicum]